MGVTSRTVRGTKRWKALRKIAIQRDQYRCVQCNAAGRLEVDHIKAVRHAPELAYALNNLQSLCPTCHTYKTRRENGNPEVSQSRLKWRRLVSNVETPTNEQPS